MDRFRGTVSRRSMGRPSKRNNKSVAPLCRLIAKLEWFTRTKRKVSPALFTPHPRRVPSASPSLVPWRSRLTAAGVVSFRIWVIVIRFQFRRARDPWHGFLNHQIITLVINYNSVGPWTHTTPVVVK